MSNHDNHDASGDNSEKFVPLSDNNNNLSFSKIITLMVSLGLVVWGLMVMVKYIGGHLENEEQVEFRIEHNRAFKDSDENKYYRTEASRESEEEMKTEEKKGEEMKEDQNKMKEEKTDDKKTEDKKMEDKKM